ncbi:MAG: phage holin family protein [Pseudolabrys sp.]
MSLSGDLNEIPRLFGDAVEQLGKLVQNEAELARAELSQKMTQAATGAGYLVGAAVLIVPVIVILLIALAFWLTEIGLSPVTAHLASGFIGAVVSGILAAVGISYLKPKDLTPKVTFQQVRRDAAAAKEMTR